MLDTLTLWLAGQMSSMTWGKAITIAEWLVRVTMVVVVPFRRSPAAAKGWLLLILFQPLFGLLVYLLFGQPILPRWREERYRRLPEIAKRHLKHIAALADKHGLTPQGPLPYTAGLAYRLSLLPPLAGNQVELLTDYTGTLDRLIADIDAAEQHVHLLFYIFCNDASGKRVIDALGRAAARGVTCRVLIDAVGSGLLANSVLRKLQKRGVAAARVRPIGLLRGRLPRADLRNHRKIAVIDGCIGYVGSQNIVNAKSRSGLLVNEELMARVRGPVVLELQTVFLADWFLETDEVLNSTAKLLPEHAIVTTASAPRGKKSLNGNTTGVLAQILASGPDHPETSVEDLILSMVYNARTRVAIVTPYFIPSEPLLQALRTATQRGVQVQLVVSRRSDSLLVHLAQRSYYSELLRNGVEVYQYRKAFMHAKYLTIDDGVGLIGSSNLDIRSFTLNAEVSMMVYSENVVTKLQAEQARCIAASTQLQHARWHQRPMPTKVLENLARLLSPLL